jgi:hypothetical protein
MDFHPSLWADVFRQNPVLMVLLGGLVGGLALTQTVKVLYLQYKLGTLPVTDGRYSGSLYLLALLSTAFFTNRLWEFIIGEHGSGLRHLVALIAGLACPYVFKAGRWGIGVAKRKYNHADSDKT